jgi:hypothetical protein
LDFLKLIGYPYKLTHNIINLKKVGGIMTFSLSEVEWSSVIKLGYRGTTVFRAFAAEEIYRGGGRIC